ncbi:MAG: GTP-binding protein [Haloferacaceae archaeon]
MDDANGGTPVTILSGALGAGKTTTLNHLLTNAGGRKVAVLVNDMGEVNVDAAMVESRADGVAELSNGCICCDLRDDLEVAVSRLAREREFDHLVVEASGISEPAPVARLFTTGAASAPYALDALATVVDASRFRETLGEGGAVTTDDVRRTRPGQAERRDGERRPLADLLVGQVECANVVLLNKCDLVDEATVETTAALVVSLNPDARVVRTTHGAVDPDALLGTGAFDLETVSETAAWRRAAEHADHEHSPQSEYGIDSFTFRARRPLHPGRFADLVGALPDAVVRSKGRAWVAGREDWALHYSHAGDAARVEVAERWVAAMPPERREIQRRMQPDLEWDDEWGDRRTELVFIGRSMDEAGLRDALADCTLTDAELDADWDAFENPFPADDGETLTL